MSVLKKIRTAIGKSQREKGYLKVIKTTWRLLID